MSKLNPLVSVIIPVYNAERFLSATVDSILNQSYTDFELILVNDGSKDSSSLIAEAYEKKDCRVKLINKQNGGVSSARNTGIANSAGKYIAFADADDTVENGFLDNMVSLISQTNTEFAVCNYRNVYPKVGSEDILHGYKDGTVFFKDDINKLCIYPIIGFNITSTCISALYPVWGKLYSSDIIKRNNLLFNPSCQFAEDFLFNIEYMMCINSLVFTNGVYYNYFHRKGSSLMSGFHSKTYETINTIQNVLSGIFPDYLRPDEKKYKAIIERETAALRNCAEHLSYKEFTVQAKTLFEKKELSEIYSKHNNCVTKYKYAKARAEDNFNKYCFFAFIQFLPQRIKHWFSPPTKFIIRKFLKKIKK